MSIEASSAASAFGVRLKSGACVDKIPPRLIKDLLTGLSDGFAAAAFVCARGDNQKHGSALAPRHHEVHAI